MSFAAAVAKKREKKEKTVHIDFPETRAPTKVKYYYLSAKFC